MTLAGLAVLTTGVGAASAGDGVKPEAGAYTTNGVNLRVAKISGKLVVDEFSHYPSELSCDEQTFTAGAGVDKDLKIKNGKFSYSGDADYVPEEYKIQVKGKFIKDRTTYGAKGSVKFAADNGSCKSERFKFTAYRIPTT